jgi:glycosyltransferase involved in cell wall biosynthesis
MLMAILRRGRQYDLIHINNLHYSHAYTAFIAGRACGLPVIISPHVHAEQRETHDVGYLHTILRGSHVVLCDTRAEKEYLQAREWNSEISVAGIGLRLDQYPPLERARSRAQFGLPADSFVILFLGRKADYKGLDFCLEAFSTLRRIRDNVYFLAVGPETEFSRRLWDRYSGLDGVVARGAVSDEERLAALAASDVLVMPSVGEAFGIVYLEAWAYRKPVIGATIRSVSSVLSHGDDAFLVEPDRPAELVRCLAHLADDPSAAAHMGEQGRMKLEWRYTVERVGDVVEAACARAIRRHRTLR